MCNLEIHFSGDQKKGDLFSPTSAHSQRCRFCQAHFEIHQELDIDSSKHECKWYKCNHCTKQLRDIVSWRRHRGESALNTWKISCLECDLDFRCLGLYNTHAETHHNTPGMECTECSVKLNSAQSLPTNLGFTCAVCLSKFSCADALVKHLLIHNEKAKQVKAHHENPIADPNYNGKLWFGCISCSSEFKSKWSLYYHVLFVHENPSIIQCYGCGKAIKKTSFNVHSKLCFVIVIVQRPQWQHFRTV